MKSFKRTTTMRRAEEARLSGDITDRMYDLLADLSRASGDGRSEERKISCRFWMHEKWIRDSSLPRYAFERCALVDHPRVFTYAELVAKMADLFDAHALDDSI